MIPNGWKCSKCTCGNIYEDIILESNNIVIHHGKPTFDSRDGPLACYYLRTRICYCTIYYSGTEDRLVRVSTANIKTKEILPFVSVDLLVEAFESLYSTSQSGKFLYSFISQKKITK